MSGSARFSCKGSFYQNLTIEAQLCTVPDPPSSIPLSGNGEIIAGKRDGFSQTDLDALAGHGGRLEASGTVICKWKREIFSLTAF